MLHDIRVALRSLLRTPGFTFTTVVTLGLATGANAAILAVVYGVLVKPLPFPDADRLVAVWPGKFHSNGDLIYTRENGRMFSGLAGMAPGFTMSLTGGGEPTRMTVARVSGNFFTVLGAEPLLGRPFTQEAERPGLDGVVVLDHGFWIRRFAGDPGIVGQTVVLDGDPVRVVAVMPRAFQLFGLQTDAYTPLAVDESAWYHRLSITLLFGRVADGLTVEQASTHYRELTQTLKNERKYSDEYGRDASVVGMQEALVGDVSGSLMLLGGAVGLILLIAGANIATLQLTRAAARSRDVAIRSALGASPGRIARQVLVENSLLALAGGGLGVALAATVLPVLIALLPVNTPRVQEIGLDLPVAGAVLAAVIVVGLSVGLFPAAGTTRLRTAALLHERANGETPVAKRLRGSFVSAEVALAVVLTIGASLMLQTLWKLRQVNPGFDPHGVLTLHLQPSGSRYRTQSIAEYYENVLQRVRALPGVRSAGGIQHLPFSGYSWTIAYEPEGFTLAPGSAPPVAGGRIVTPGYFQAIGQPLLAGRDMEPGDAVRQGVVIVNQTLAAKHFRSPDAAIGRSIRVRGPQGMGPPTRIVGVVGNVHHSTLTTAPAPEVYTSVSRSSINAMMLAVRGEVDVLSLVPAVREAIWSIDRDVPLSAIETMEAKIGRSLGQPRLLLILLGGFAALGGSLALLGVYGVVTYSVAQRRRELGIMIALGAGRERIMRSVLREAFLYGFLGLVIGIPAASAGSGLLRSLIFGVSTRDPATYLAIACVTMVTVVGASILPAVRASMVDPVRALKV